MSFIDRINPLRVVRENRRLRRNAKEDVETILELSAQLMALSAVSESLRLRLEEEMKKPTYQAEMEEALDDLAITKAELAESENQLAECQKSLREQTELNASLIDQKFGFEVDAKSHSLAVSSKRIQVLTQITAVHFDCKQGLFKALVNIFVLNVTRHLFRKLKAEGYLSISSDVSANQVKEALRLNDWIKQ